MRVQFKSRDEFLIAMADLASHPYDFIHQNTVRVSIDYNTESEVKETVTVHITAIVICHDESQYILEFAEQVGSDYLDAGGDKQGTKNADQLLQSVTAIGKWRIVPGIISIG